MFYFQQLEHMVNETLALLANADGEIVYTLINRLEYSNRLKIADILFARLVDLRSNIDSAMTTKFHELMELIVELEKCGICKNELVHSRYAANIFYHIDSTNKKTPDCRGF